MARTTTVTIPAAHLVTRTYTLGEGWGEDAGKEVTLELTAARTSKGNDTHIATIGIDERASQSFITSCGLMAGQRVHHTVWSIAPTRITCEVCNGVKGKGRGGKPSEFRQQTAAIFAEKARK